MRSDIIEKIKSTVSATTKKAVKISGDAIDYTKIKFKIAEINSRLDEKYAAIGLAVYEDSDDADIEAICTEIKELRDELEVYKLKLSQYKNQKFCSACGAVCNNDDTFCKECGEKL